MNLGFLENKTTLDSHACFGIIIKLDEQGLVLPLVLVPKQGRNSQGNRQHEE